jgi:flagellar basal body P-ring protein FlgI
MAKPAWGDCSRLRALQVQEAALCKAVAHEIVESAISKAIVTCVVSEALRIAINAALEEEQLAATAHAAATATATAIINDQRFHSASCGCLPIFTSIKTKKGCAKAINSSSTKVKVPSSLVTGAGRFVAAIKNIRMSPPSVVLSDKVVVVAKVQVLPAAPGPKRLQALKQFLTKGLSMLSCKSMQ